MKGFCFLDLKCFKSKKQKPFIPFNIVSNHLINFAKFF